MDVDVALKTEVSTGFRAAKVIGMFDVPRDATQVVQIKAHLPIEDRDWQVGAIIGASGTGKTTIAATAWPNGHLISGDYSWGESTLLDDFPAELTPDDIVGFLTAVGFSSPPAWLRSYHVLSTGQKFRADVARALSGTRPTASTHDGPIVFDEFTSTVDRTVAKAVSNAVGKHVRRGNRQFVAVSCHKDFIPWLQPDWVFDTDYSEFTWGCNQRPGIRMVVREGLREAWGLFRTHHYLTGTMSRSTRVFLAYIKIEDEEERLAGFLGILPSPGHKGWWRAHRFVVLPDLQGLGIGNRFQELVAETLWVNERKRYRIVTSAPGVVKYAVRNPNKWRMSMAPKMKPVTGKTSTTYKRGGKPTLTSAGRLTTTLVYVPEELRR